MVLLQLQKVQGRVVCPPLHRAKKIRNKAVVNTSTLMRESRAENNKLLLGRGNSRMAGKPSQELARVQARSQEAGSGGEEGRGRGQAQAWGPTPG